MPLLFTHVQPLNTAAARRLPFQHSNWMKKTRTSQRLRPSPEPPKRSYKLALWSLVVTFLILAVKLLPYIERW